MQKISSNVAKNKFVFPASWDIKKLPAFPKRLLLGLQDGRCNLKCPHCFVHGSDNRHETQESQGSMSPSNAARIFGEVRGKGIFVSPVIWSEPLLILDFEKVICRMKENGINIFINTNGLLLTEDRARFLVESQVHSVFISIDAMTEGTLKTIRGIKDLNGINESVFRMLIARQNRVSPRIGVSFVETDANVHEKADFISYWLRHVDVVRTTKVYEKDNSVKNAEIPQKRVPCGALYDTMVINHKGDVPICCLDAFNETNAGNVFEENIEKVWHGSRLQKIRYYHETGQYEKVPLCKSCDVWSQYLISEETKSGILIRKSPVMTYYNREDRLFSWTCRMK